MAFIIDELRTAAPDHDSTGYLMEKAASQIEGLIEDLDDCNLDRELWRKRAEDLEEALQKIVQWAEAYPTDIFHEPPAEEAKKANELLNANGMTLDAFSASMGRHCLAGVGDIARSALEKPRNG